MIELTPTTGGTSPGSPRRSLTKRLLREPLVHFLLAGLVHAANSTGGNAENRDEI